MSLHYYLVSFLLLQTSHHKSSHLTLVHLFDFNLQRKLDNTVSFSPFLPISIFRRFTFLRRFVLPLRTVAWCAAGFRPGSLLGSLLGLRLALFPTGTSLIFWKFLKNHTLLKNMFMISKQKRTQTTNHFLWFVIISQTVFVISKRAQFCSLYACLQDGQNGQWRPSP
jgi:hypothetical protein